ncbi:MAG: efflux RND transporter periplasmic adaptor subunit [Mucilaginibacter polytrichastri]|nr:efflux RND transporter periplasmic adaptor subunit [Mucilaginibacter polytrichastri]
MKTPVYIAIAGALLSLASCKQKADNTESKKEVCISDSMAKLIRIDTAKVEHVDDELNLSGEVSFDENTVVKVFPFASGQVLSVNVSLGDKVSKGQTLAVIRSADVAGEYTDLSSADADVAVAKRQLDQAKSLYENGISSEREYTEARENYNKAAAASRKVKDQLTINGGGNTAANGQYIIRAPESGYIVEKKITAGNFLRSDAGDNLFTISDMKDVWIWANVFESDIARVKQGYSAKVSTLAYPGKVFAGKVDQVSDVLDPENKVLKVKIILPNNNMMLKPEMFTNVLINNTEGTEMVSIPSEAIIFDSSKNYVIVYHGKCNLEIREVSISKTVNGISYIATGLKAGDQVISKNEVLLYNAILED